MSWSRALYETYENCKSAVCIDKEHPDAAPLPPLYHDQKKIGYELFIDKNGNFSVGTARKIDDEPCIVPTSEASEGRVGSMPTPAPLFDDLKYMAGDYAYYVGDEGQRRYFDTYIKQLREWCESDCCIPEIRIICSYLEKETLIHDLMSSGAIPLDKNGVIIKKELQAIVRIGISRGLDDPFLPWESPEAWESHIAYMQSLSHDTGLCYISGYKERLTVNHPKIVGNAKLISSNQDNNGFIVNAGFLAGAENAVSVGYESSQKIHLALKWLIRRQGYYVKDQIWLAFGTNEPSVISINADTSDIALDASRSVTPDTCEIFAGKLRKAVRGYRQDFKGYGKVVILGANAVTPGRLSIIYHQESDENFYLEKIENWHSSCTWLHKYKPDFNDTSKNPKPVTFYGALALIDIVKAAYGENASNKLIMSAYARLVPCITEGVGIPKDIMTQLARSAAKPEGKKNWEYRKANSIACALIRKFYNDREGREVYKMPLDKEWNDRSYLFGRWLAYAHNVENFALYVSGTERSLTNAERMMHQFSIHPVKTMKIINDQLEYYFKKAAKYPSSHIMKKEMADLCDRIGRNGFNDNRLSEVYLLGYNSQLIDIYNSIREFKEMNDKLIKEDSGNEHS